MNIILLDHNMLNSKQEREVLQRRRDIQWSSLISIWLRAPCPPQYITSPTMDSLFSIHLNFQSHLMYVCPPQWFNSKNFSELYYSLNLYLYLYLYLHVLHNLSPLNGQSVPTFHLFPSSHTSQRPNCNIYILQLAFDRTTEVLRLFKFLNIERKTPPRVLDGFFLGYYVRHAHKMTAVA